VTDALASFKLRFHDAHVRVMPARFAGPGVDVRGEDARRCFELAKDMIAWLLARQPSVTLRALSVDFGKQRVLVSFEDAHATGVALRPMVLRIDPPESTELIERAAPLTAHLVKLAREAISKRSVDR
jgi:hypothetical protein